MAWIGIVACRACDYGGMWTCVESFNPKRGREGGVQEQCANAVVQGVQNASRLPILLRHIGTGEPKKNVVLGVELAQRGVIELASVRTDRAPKLGLSEGLERHDMLGNLGLVAQGNCPNEMSEVIKENEIILKTSKACNWGRPNITVN